MADRFKFAEVRQEVIEMLKKDLLGPSSENEILNQNPRFEYIVGMLAPQTSENDSNEQEVDGDASFEGDADYTVGEDDDNEPVFTNRFKTPSSIGISFYLESSTKSFNVDVTWGDYTKASDKTTNKEGKKVDVSTYTRHPQKETVVIDLQEFSKNKEYPLVCDSNVILYISKISLKQGYTLVTAYVINKRKNPESDIAGMMFQVNLCAYSQEKMDIFVAEHICRKILAVDEFYFAQRPIYFGDDMSGVLLYTGSADKEGSLGGLVELGNIDQLIVLMKDAFQEALVCTNDPECLNNVPAGNNSNGAACHSCCMISETACENGNRMLDRGLIVPIDGRENQSYFKTLVEELCQLEV